MIESKGNGDLVACGERLALVVAQVQEASWVAVDTEADSLYSYPERLCLLQVGLPEGETLVDTLADLDLGQLKEALAGHRLILHGGDYDLRLLYRAMGLTPQGVFDTMLAARLLGIREFGLEKLLAQFLNVKLEKGPQKANWARRPLTSRMIEYARNDARYLKPLADRLQQDLEAKGRVTWHQAICARLVRECARGPEVDEDRVWRLSGAHRLTRRGLAVLRALWHWRDGEARRLRRPPYFVLAHEVLVQLAEQAAGQGGFRALLPRKYPAARRAALMEAIEKALDLPESSWPHLRRSVGVRLTARQRQVQVQMQARRDRAAAELDIDPSLIASRAVLVKLAGGRLEPGEDLMPWQRELLELE